mgnify:CR=1 FL=1
MSVPMKTRRTKSAVKIVVGEHQPMLFLVPRKTAVGVVELLRPFVSHVPKSEVSADVVFEDLYGRNGKAGTVIKGFRVRDSMTQERLAAKLGATQGDVSAMEHGRRPIGKTMAARLAKVFNTDYRVFL